MESKHRRYKLDLPHQPDARNFAKRIYFRGVVGRNRCSTILLTFIESDIEIMHGQKEHTIFVHGLRQGFR